MFCRLVTTLVLLAVQALIFVPTATQAAQIPDLRNAIVIYSPPNITVAPQDDIIELDILIGRKQDAAKKAALTEVDLSVDSGITEPVWKGSFILPTTHVEQNKVKDYLDSFLRDYGGISQAQGEHLGDPAFKRGFHAGLLGVKLSPGQQYKLNITLHVQFDSGDRLPFTESAILSVPALSDEKYWYPGDGHVHTKWSDGSAEIGDRIVRANKYGLAWIAITDHTQQIAGQFGCILGRKTGQHHGRDNDILGNSDYATYFHYIVNENARLCVIPGLEYSTRDPRYTEEEYKGLVPSNWMDAHLLVYGLHPSRFVPNPMPRKPGTATYALSYGLNNFTGQHIIDALVNSGYAIACIAHPYSLSYPWFHDNSHWKFENLIRRFSTMEHGWDDINVQGSIGMEVRSGGDDLINYKAEGESLKRLDKMLHANMHVYVMANSDSHGSPLPEDIGKYKTYVYIGKQKPIQRSDVLSALKAGRTVASTGPLLIMWIRTPKLAGIGDTEQARVGDDLEVALYWVGASKPDHVKLTYHCGSDDYVKDVLISTFEPVSENQAGNVVLMSESFLPLTATDVGSGYIRASANMNNDSLIPGGSAYTSPIYLHVSPAGAPDLTTNTVSSFIAPSASPLRH